MSGSMFSTKSYDYSMDKVDDDDLGPFLFLFLIKYGSLKLTMIKVFCDFSFKSTLNISGNDFTVRGSYLAD